VFNSISDILNKNGRERKRKTKTKAKTGLRGGHITASFSYFGMRELGLHPECRGFESLTAHHSFYPIFIEKAQ
jgi:hypothetical protein